MAKYVVINGVNYSNVPEVHIPETNNHGEPTGRDAVFYDTSDATVGANDILEGQIAYGEQGQITGTVHRDFVQYFTITTKDQKVSYSGWVVLLQAQIAQVEQNKIISENIKSGVTILGVTGSATVKDVSDTTATANTVLSGYDFYNASGVLTSGSLTVPSISQDGTTKILSIS